MWTRAALLLQVSGLVSPMYLDEEVPPGRAVQAIVVVHTEAARVSQTETRTRAEALALVAGLRERVLAGESFAALAFEHSDHRSATGGGVLGTYWPGMLSPEMDAFLFSAEIGDVSEPLDTPLGVQLLRRIEARAGCRHIQIDGTDDDSLARCRELLARARAGEDFAELARAHSDHAVSAARGGAWGIYERGAHDTLLRAAAFEAKPGEIVGPIRSPVAYHLIQRVDPSTLPAELEDDYVARGRAIVIGFDGGYGIDPEIARPHAVAEALAHELAERIRAGEDMATVAREINDDPGGRERAGDLGWVHRHASVKPPVLDRLFQAPVGELVGPVATNAGWILLRRER